MSRTTKTAPMRVKAVSHPGTTCIESHHHEKGFCDLPELTIGSVGWGRPFLDGKESCYWSFGPAIFYDGKYGCGCSMCSDIEGRKRKARKSRYAGRREAQSELTEALHDEDIPGFSFIEHRHDWFRTTIDERFEEYARLAKELELAEGTVVVDVDFEEGFIWADAFDETLDLNVAKPDLFAVTLNLLNGARGRVKL